MRAARPAGSSAPWAGSASSSCSSLLTVVIAAAMYAGGERAAAMVQHFGHRLAGERGRQSVLLAGQAIRGVALGVVVTALLQSVLGGIGLASPGCPLPRC